MAEFRIPRTGRPDLVFDGKLVAEASSKTEGGPRSDRWTELRIWATDTDKWVVQVYGGTSIPGEVDRNRVSICSSPAHVGTVLALRNNEADHPLHGKPYFTRLARQLLEDAGRKDDRLVSILEERI